MQPLIYCDDKPLPPKEEILHRLAGRAGREALVEMERLLCPCRNTCRDIDVWRAMLSLYKHHRGEVREGAHHAVISLRERARIDTQTAALLHALGIGPGQHRHRRLWVKGERPRMVRNDVPTLIEMLASDDVVEQRDALRALFDPAHHVATSVLREIERATKSNDARIRARATIALRRLQEHRRAAA